MRAKASPPQCLAMMPGCSLVSNEAFALILVDYFSLQHNGLMSSDDDPTKEADEAKYDTKPGITAILERINQLGESLRAEIAESRQSIESRLDKLESDVTGLQTEMRAGFKRLEKKLDLLNKNDLELRTDQELLEGRVEALEEKAS